MTYANNRVYRVFEKKDGYIITIFTARNLALVTRYFGKLIKKYPTRKFEIGVYFPLLPHQQKYKGGKQK